VGYDQWRWLVRASGETGDARIEALKRAYEAEPGNYYTSYLIGSFYRRLSFNGDANYQTFAQQGIEWSQRSSQAHPYFPQSVICQGMCLDWLGRHDEALACFQKASALDPNGIEAADGIAWHYIQIHDYARAKDLLFRSLHLQWDDPFALTYIRIVDQCLKDPWFTAPPQ
jgi:tetratricopeptide (TPR) repeat protein